MALPAIPPEYLALTMAGKVKTLPYEPLTADEVALFDKDFGGLANKFLKLDPEVGRNFMEARSWYLTSAGIAKDSMRLTFGGVEPSSGQFGMAPLMSYPMLAARTWNVNVVAGWQNYWGSSASPIAGSAVSGSQKMYAFQDIISPGPSSIQALRFNINEHQYPVYPVELFTKVPKTNSYLKLIPLWMRPLIHTKGKFYLRVQCEQAGVEKIQPLGLLFAEFAYLNTETNFYT